MTIRARSIGHQTLKQVMAGNNIPHFSAGINDTHLPNLTGFQGNFSLLNNGFNKLFVIGRSSYPQAALEDNFVVVTNLTTPPQTGFVQERRSYQDDPETNGHPTQIGNLLIGEVTSDYPSFPGMSGGPVLECKLVNNGFIQRRCRIIGVHWGSERIFNNINDLINLKSILSSIQ